VKGRDRIVLIALVVIAVLGAGWILLVKPERQEASKLQSQVAEAQSKLSSAESTLQNARRAKEQYEAAYAAVVNLGKAVPASEEVPSLMYQLAQASNQKRVDFASISTSTSGSGSGSGAGGAAGAGASAASASSAPTAFTQMPFTFVFNGSFFQLDHLFEELDRFTKRSTTGDLQVSGRLLTIQSVKLSPASGGGATAKGPSTELTGTITATAYVLPASQGLTNGATASAPASSATPTSGATSSSPATPAIARVTP
jgi:hypothetical protein